MIRKTLSLCGIFGAAILATAQSPADGRTEGGRYVNSFFHFSYTWPQGLHPIDVQSLLTQPPAKSTNEFLLFTARQADEPFGVVMIAEKPNPHGPLPGGMNDSQSFLDHVKKVWDQAGKPRALSESQYTSPDRLTFYELDYTIFDEYASAIAVQMAEFQIVFKCDAKDPNQLREITR
jgi:hypothetical protein